MDQDGGRIDSVDLLSLWRTVPFRGIDDATIARLAGSLLAIARASDPELEPMLLRAQARDPRAWFDLARVMWGSSYWDSKMGRTRDAPMDAHASCLLVATAYGSAWAAAMLVLRLARRGSAKDDPSDRVEILVSLSSLFSLPSVDPAAVVDYLGVRDVIMRELGAPKARRVPLPSKVTTSPVAEEPVGPAVSVLAERPEMAGEKDFRSLLERYEVLASPITLCPAPDPDGLADSLVAEFPWAVEAVEAIRVELRLAGRLGGGIFRLPPIMLLGDPGVGKSTFVRRVGALSGIPMATIVGAGSLDNRLIAGTARGWSSAYPCFPLVAIRRFMTANPILVVEDVDKSGGSGRNGRLADTLAAMIDPSTARAWMDECLQVQADLSLVTWFVTANRIDMVAPGIRSRCRIVSFPRPRPQDFEVLVSGILRDVAEEYQVQVEALPELPVQVINELRRGFQSGRLQARQLSTLVRRLLATEAAAERHHARH